MSFYNHFKWNFLLFNISVTGHKPLPIFLYLWDKLVPVWFPFCSICSNHIFWGLPILFLLAIGIPTCHMSQQSPMKYGLIYCLFFTICWIQLFSLICEFFFKISNSCRYRQPALIIDYSVKTYSLFLFLRISPNFLNDFIQLTRRHYGNDIFVNFDESFKA